MWTRQKYPCKRQRIKHMQGLRYFIATDVNFHEKVSLKYCRISCLEKARLTLVDSTQVHTWRLANHSPRKHQAAT